MTQLLTIAEVAERLHRKPGTISAWIKNRGLPFVQLGHRSFYIPSDQLDAWIAGQVKANAVPQHKEIA